MLKEQCATRPETPAGAESKELPMAVFISIPFMILGIGIATLPVIFAIRSEARSNKTAVVGSAPAVKGMPS
jgi:hypothetical protein